MNELMFLYIPELVNNQKYIYELFENHEKDMVEFDSKEGKNNSFVVARFRDTFLESIINDIVGDVEYNLRIYKHYKNKNHSMHKDVGGIQCSLNYLIGGYDSPVIFYDDNKNETGRYHYQCGLLNILKYHSIPPSKQDRVFLRFAFKKPFDEIKELFKDYEAIPYKPASN